MVQICTIFCIIKQACRKRDGGILCPPHYYVPPPPDFRTLRRPCKKLPETCLPLKIHVEAMVLLFKKKLMLTLLRDDLVHLQFCRRHQGPKRPSRYEYVDYLVPKSEPPRRPWRRRPTCGRRRSRRCRRSPRRSWSCWPWPPPIAKNRQKLD